MFLYRVSEERTRKEMIDPQLEKAGWYLRAIQSVFLQKRHLEAANLYEPPLDMFGADAVERWFTEKEVEEIVEFTENLDGVPVWCGLFLNREEREVRKDLKAFLRVLGVLRGKLTW
jgi:hypothetical protein